MNELREEWQAISNLLRTASNLLAKCEGHYGRSAEVVALEAAIEAFYETGELKAHALTRSRLAEWEAACDEAGLPHDPVMLVRHHRANAQMAGAADAASLRILESRLAEVERERDASFDEVAKLRTVLVMVGSGSRERWEWLLESARETPRGTVYTLEELRERLGIPPDEPTAP